MLRTRWLGAGLIATLAGGAAVGTTMTADSLTLSGLSRTDKAVVLLGGMRPDSTCVVGAVHQYPDPGPLSLGSLIETSDECYSELVVFSPNNAPLLVIDYSWTSAPDARTIDLEQRIVLPAKVRVVESAAGFPQVLQRVHEDVALANGIFQENRVGVRIQTNGNITRITPGSAQAGVIGNGCMSVDDLLAGGAPLYSPDTINVYYVSEIRMPREPNLVGYDCFSQGAPNIIYVALAAPSTVLTHELGHAFSLRFGNGHVPADFLKPGGETNIMRKDEALDPDFLDSLDAFRLGQVYRMTFDKSSWLNLSGRRTGPTRFCQDKDDDAGLCPPLGLRFP